MEQMDEDAFAGYLGNMVASGMTAMNVSLGADLGLFDVLISFDRPASSTEIAAKGEFQERWMYYARNMETDMIKLYSRWYLL